MKLTELHRRLGSYLDRWGDRYVIDSDGRDVGAVFPPELVYPDGLDERDRRLAVMLSCFVEAR